MSRLFYMTGFAILGVVGALIVLNLLNGSVDARRDALAVRLENARSGDSLMHAEQEMDFEAIQYDITSNPNLWAPLTKPQLAAEKPPELDKILAGVTISPNTVGSGDDIKIKIMTPEDRNGQWLGIGGIVKGLTIKEIDSRRRSVTFSQQFQGREYTFTLRP